MNKILLFLLLLLFKSPVNAQYIEGLMNSGVIDDSKPLQTSPWKSSVKRDYVGEYSFGFSESESTLEIKLIKGKYTVKLTGGYFDKKGHWKKVIKTLSNVNISNGRFYSNQFSGKFVYVSLPYNSNSTTLDTTSAAQSQSSYHQGLQIMSEWNGLGKNEIGLKRDY
jgi:hypothetical protein